MSIVRHLFLIWRVGGGGGEGWGYNIMKKNAYCSIQKPNTIKQSPTRNGDERRGMDQVS